MSDGTATNLDTETLSPRRSTLRQGVTAMTAGSVGLDCPVCAERVTVSIRLAPGKPDGSGVEVAVNIDRAAIRAHLDLHGAGPA